MLELFKISAVLWFVAGLVLLLVELLLPGVVIVFFGIGAWITALACLFFDFGFNTQLVIFLVSSVSSLSILRRYLVKNNSASVPFLNTNELNQEFIGHTCTVSTAIIPGLEGGRVQFRGTQWKALSEVAIAAGETVRIVAKDSIVLIVAPLT